LIIILLSLRPNILGDVENFNTARITTTPPHIQPEWYFLFAYAILRSTPSKLGGVIAIVIAILILIAFSLKKSRINTKFSFYKKNIFWVFIRIVILLT